MDEKLVRRGEPEFDLYSSSYGDLLADPMREKFARDPLYFHKRKLGIIAELLAEQNKNPANMKWLDVGCGQGDLLRLGRGMFAEAVGCDPASTMLPAQGDIPVIVQPSLDKLPFDNQSVDFVTAVCVFHHVHGVARTALAQEIRRVLTPGGYFCLIEHNPWNPITRGIVKRCPVDVDAELLTTPQAKALIASARMETNRIRYFLFFPEKLKALSGAERYLGGFPLGGQYAILAR